MVKSQTDFLKRWLFTVPGIQNKQMKHIYRVIILLHMNKLHLSRVDLALDDIKYGYIAVVGLTLDRRGYHHVLWLQQAPHHIENGRLAHTGHLNVDQPHLIT